MPQDTTHPVYDYLAPLWERTRAALAGVDTIKSGGSSYLPMPTGMDSRTYANYKARAEWFPATARTHTVFGGLVFRRPISFAGVDTLDEHIDNITLDGTSVYKLARMIFNEYLVSGTGGVLVDLPADPVSINVIRPIWRAYLAEAIVNWRMGTLRDGRQGLTQVVLHESIDSSQGGDSYSHETQDLYRELRIDSEGFYEVLLWLHSENNFSLIEQFQPQRLGSRLDFIPFSLIPHVVPPLLDLADLNIHHYQVSADHRWQLHMTGMITPVFINCTSLPATIALGPEGLSVSGTDAQVMLLEPRGDGLSAHLDKLASLKEDMASAGSRILAQERRVAETAETLGIRQAAEHSALYVWAEIVERCLEQALRWHAWLANAAAIPNDSMIQLSLNRDFLTANLSPQALGSLVESWLQGALTEEDLFYNLQQGELLEPGEEFDSWRGRRRIQAPAIFTTLNDVNAGA